MFVRKALKLKHFENMESPVMKENHLLVTYGGMFMIVLIAKKKELLKKITLEGKKKNLPNTYSKKDMK